MLKTSIEPYVGALFKPKSQLENNKHEKLNKRAQDKCKGHPILSKKMDHAVAKSIGPLKQENMEIEIINECIPEKLPLTGIYIPPLKPLTVTDSVSTKEKTKLKNQR